MSGFQGFGEFNFCYNSQLGMTLEDALVHIAKSLHGRSWCAEQKADLVVIAETAHHRYMLNEPSKEAKNRLALEYGGHEQDVETDVDKTRLWRVTVRNMVTTGRDSVVLEAFVKDAEATKDDEKPGNGYCHLVPTYMNLSTMEIDALMTLLIKLKMLKLSENPELKWLRNAYKNLRRMK